jgi:hypothetical protein
MFVNDIQFLGVTSLQVNLTRGIALGGIETSEPDVRWDGDWTHLTLKDESNPPMPILSLTYKSAIVRRKAPKVTSIGTHDLEGIDPFTYQIRP